MCKFSSNVKVIAIYLLETGVKYNGLQSRLALPM